VVFCSFAWFLGFLFTLVRGEWIELAGKDIFDPDFLTILTAYLFLLYGRTISGTFALGQGLLVDVFSAGLQGLFGLLYLGVFGGIYLGSRFFNLQEPKGQFFLISFVVLLKKVMFFTLLAVFSRGFVFSNAHILFLGSSAIVTGLFAPVIFFLFNRLEKAT